MTDATHAPRRRLKGWTPEDDEILVRLYNAGSTISEISKEVGRTVRETKGRRDLMVKRGRCQRRKTGPVVGTVNRALIADERQKARLRIASDRLLAAIQASTCGPKGHGPIENRLILTQ